MQVSRVCYPGILSTIVTIYYYLVLGQDISCVAVLAILDYLYLFKKILDMVIFARPHTPVNRRSC